MPPNQERIKQLFTALLSDARATLSACGWDGDTYQLRHPGEDAYYRFRTEALNLIRRVCGADSDHYMELKRLAEGDQSTNAFYMVHCVGIVEAALRDFENDSLFDMRSLIAAELLGDFFDQAAALLQAGYHVPAASLCGAVLEDALRRLCEKHAISLPDVTKIDRLNADLARAGVYDKLVQKQITALADIRNSADHGRFEKVSTADVEEMLKWVKRFTSDFLR